MKLEFHPLLTIRIASKPGALLLSHLLLFLRCSILSFLVYATALKSWSPFPGDAVIKGAVRCLAYPVFFTAKPLFKFNKFADNFYYVPHALDLPNPPTFRKGTTIIDDNSVPSGFYINDLYFQHPGFTLHMFFFSFWYYIFILIVKKMFRKLRPNP